MSRLFLPIPDLYKILPEEELIARIRAYKERLGERLVILTHHYQREEIVALGDYLGDSYVLAKRASLAEKAEHIVFCGVHFMAESADILSRPGQTVYLPNPYAGCPMADMAQPEDVLRAWEAVIEVCGEGVVLPLSYMNSSADLKAFCGRNGGLICTSSNARQAFQWVFARAEKVFFFPDEHLGRNTANALGISPARVIVWDFKKPYGGHSKNEILSALVIVWKGFCHVHINFGPDQVLELRQQYPGIKIVVHPECTEEVVALADAVGSTSQIAKYVESAEPGSTIAIGTEINLVSRLAHEQPDKTIFQLNGIRCSMCVNMFRTSLLDLLFTLDNLGRINIVKVAPEIKKEALIALNRMLEVATG